MNTYADTEKPQGEGIAWGLVEEESPVKPDDVLIAEASIPGHRIKAFHLAAVAKHEDVASAAWLDFHCHACLVCGLNFFDPDRKLWICNVCDDRVAPQYYKDDCDG